MWAGVAALINTGRVESSRLITVARTEENVRLINGIREDEVAA